MHFGPDKHTAKIEQALIDSAKTKAGNIESEYTQVQEGHARILDGREVSFGQYKIGTFAFLVEICPYMGRQNSRIETFVISEGGEILAGIATEIIAGRRSMATAPLEATVLSVVQQLTEDQAFSA